ncbi:amino acid adenylation domain-containing protein [Streptomyces sp. GMR22]|uniref:amino acid adenylation domain-containing protein n=1 Tax=Streptomyces sp. GMR22 TaxID=2759524 RepID=UPI0015F94A2E|nr:amino acid adenylation domain-containing protein [Streptomyces sp. GMR22]MBA6439091.1 amino acid adenylation domain-containing protein [Streptomyces sp. GMR22]
MNAHDTRIGPDAADGPDTVHGPYLVKGPDAVKVPDTALALVADRVATAPHAPAVRSADESLSYAEVWERSEALARGLLRHGAGRGRAVGLLAERSADLVVAILGILRAGAVCVPLDAGYPTERLRYMCTDSQVDVMVGHAGQFRRLGGQKPLGQHGSLTIAGRHRPGGTEDLPTVMADDVAYLVYTSGSTGRPKGVMFEHRNLANLIAWQIRESRCGEGDRTLQFSPASFDIVFQEVFSTLGSAGTVVCCSEEQRLDPELLRDLIAEERINRVFMPFVAIQSLAQCADVMTPDDHPIREIITAGEQVQCNSRIRAMFERLPDCRLVNQWGTTETHVATSCTLPVRVRDWPLLPPIGRPIANSHVHVCDPDGRPLPPGETGELWVAGQCVGPGYLGLLERTARSYVPDPCDPRVRAYRTGDLGVLGEHGQLEFLGRMDNQVKVRGFRIELGEVETALNSLPGIAESVVVVRGDEVTEKYLQAVVVPSIPELDRKEVSKALRRSLPGYLVPSRIVLTDTLPRTPSGKLDRRAAAEVCGSPEGRP